MYDKIGIVGLGFVGGSIYKSFTIKNINVVGYDKYKDGGIGSFNDLLDCDMVFLCLPTLFSNETQCYDKSAIYEVCELLSQNEYKGVIILKSTIEPETTNKLAETYRNLKLCHNPEFLTARTAFEDFHNQTHIVIGFTDYFNDSGLLEKFYAKYFPNAVISVCSSLESESMKIFCNSFYASKIMLFTEYYLLCQKNGADFEKIKEIMFKNNWINPMHTSVPGPDGLLGYGGACFPKDTKALLNYLKEYKTEYKVLESVTIECDKIRNNSE